MAPAAGSLLKVRMQRNDAFLEDCYELSADERHIVLYDIEYFRHFRSCDSLAQAGLRVNRKRPAHPPMNGV